MLFVSDMHVVVNVMNVQAAIPTTACQKHAYCLNANGSFLLSDRPLAMTVALTTVRRLTNNTLLIYFNIFSYSQTRKTVNT